MKRIRPKDLTISYDRYGYKVLYLGRPIYSAGVMRGDKKPPVSNLKLFKEAAEHERSLILNGYGGFTPTAIDKRIVAIQEELKPKGYDELSPEQQTYLRDRLKKLPFPASQNDEALREGSYIASDFEEMEDRKPW